MCQVQQSGKQFFWVRFLQPGKGGQETENGVYQAWVRSKPDFINKTIKTSGCFLEQSVVSDDCCGSEAASSEKKAVIPVRMFRMKCQHGSACHAV